MNIVTSTRVTIDLDYTARGGKQQVVFRCRGEDKRDIDRAAKMLGLNFAQFVRMVLVQASRKIIADGSMK